MSQAIGAERAILSILIKEPTLLFDVDDVLTERDFTNSGAQIIYRLIKDVLIEDRDAQIDQYVLISRAEERGIDDFLNLTHNGDLINAIQHTKVNSANLGKYVAAVKTATVKRETIEILDVLKDEVEEYDGGAIDIKNHVEDSVFKSFQQIDDGGDDIECVADSFEEVINEYADKNSLLGLDVCLPRWQRDVGALRNGTVTGLFARAKAGKSQFSAHCAVEVAVKQRLPVLYLDTELQLRMQQMRTAGILSGVSYSRIESGAWKSSQKDIDALTEAFGAVKDAPFYYKNIAGKSIKYVIPIIRKFFHKYVSESKGDKPKCLIIYDYLKLMDPADLKQAAEWQLLGFVMSAIHDLAAQLNIPILCLGQLNREALRVDSEGTVSGSDRITHNLDSLTIMRAKKEEELDADGSKRGNYILKGILARSGPGHDYNEHVNLKFDKSSGQFIEDKRHSEVLEAIQGNPEFRDRLEDEDIGPLGDMRED